MRHRPLLPVPPARQARSRLIEGAEFGRSRSPGTIAAPADSSPGGLELRSRSSEPVEATIPGQTLDLISNQWVETN